METQNPVKNSCNEEYELVNITDEFKLACSLAYLDFKSNLSRCFDSLFKEKKNI